MNIALDEQIKLLSKQLKIPTFTGYHNIQNHADPNSTFGELLLELMRTEYEQRQENNNRRRLKQANFPFTKTIDELDLSRYDGQISDLFISELASCRFIDEKKNLVMIGNPGRGKTHMAIGIGLKACAGGKSVLFKNAASLSTELSEAKDNYALGKLEKRIQKVDLLVIDEMGYVSFDRFQSELLFKVILECFQSIPKQLSKENKKFQYSVVKKGSTASKYAGSLQWIEDAGIISRCYNLTATELPLDGNAQDDVFKVYMRDCGLFISMLEDGTQFDVLQGNLARYKGAIFENLIADMFTKMGRKLYYFHKNSGLEVGFVIRYKGACTLVEVKASSGNTKSTKTILAHPEKYHVNSAIKLGDYNVGRSGEILTLPLYMAFLLTEV